MSFDGIFMTIMVVSMLVNVVLILDRVFYDRDYGVEVNIQNGIDRDVIWTASEALTQITEKLKTNETIHLTTLLQMSTISHVLSEVAAVKGQRNQPL